MKKSIILGLFASMAILASAQQLQEQPIPRTMAPQATTEDALSMEYGYCGEMNSSIGWEKGGTIRAVIEIPQEIATKYQGTQITQFLAGIGNDAGSDAKIFIMRTLDDEEFLYSQEVKFSAQKWNEYKLTTPFTLDGEGFFIGYELTVASEKSFPVGVDKEVSNPYGDLCAMYDTENNEWVWEHLSAFDLGNNCIKIVLTGDNLPRYNLALQSLNIKDYVKAGDPFTISGIVKNRAALTTESFDVSYKIGDNEAVVTPVTAKIESGEVFKFNIDNVVIENDGAYDITVEVVSINGNADEDNSDNSMTKTVNSLSDLVPRKILIEEFSTTQCSNCPRVHTVMKEILEGRDDIALVVHHTGYGQDNYTISASRTFLDFYASSTYAPALMIDRTNLAEQGAEGYDPSVGSVPSPGPVFAPNSKKEIEEYINYCFAQPAFVTVNIEDTYNAETRELTVRVQGESVIELPQTPYINIFVTESGMINYQAGGGNDYEHNHAIRAVLTNTWGDELAITNGQYDVTYTCKLDNKWKPENMDIVAFVAHYDEKDINNCNVFNAEHKELDYAGAAEKMEKDTVSVWSANGNIYIAGAYKQAEVYGIDGRMVAKVSNTTAIDVENSGVYVVRVDGMSYKVIL